MILRRDAKVKLISRVPLFEGCSGRELAQVASIAQHVELPEGAVLIREGEPGRDFFALVEGSVDVRKNGRRIATLGAGDFVGEIALLTNAPRTATVRARSPISALRLTRQGFSTLLDASPRMRAKVLKTLADRLAPSAL
ncbi:MAG TPA: cyclic nucleotide-binding domain-containing protein [Gaiellaceae bacterium]